MTGVDTDSETDVFSTGLFEAGCGMAGASVSGGVWTSLGVK